MPAGVVSIPGVELVRVGVHEISTGTWEVTRQDLADAVAAALAMLMDNRAGGRLIDVDAAIDLTVLRRVVVVPRARNG